jgi:hypothetical protein
VGSTTVELREGDLRVVDCKKTGGAGCGNWIYGYGDKGNQIKLLGFSPHREKNVIILWREMFEKQEKKNDVEEVGVGVASSSGSFVLLSEFDDGTGSGTVYREHAYSFVGSTKATRVDIESERYYRKMIEKRNNVYYIYRHDGVVDVSGSVGSDDYIAIGVGGCNGYPFSPIRIDFVAAGKSAMHASVSFGSEERLEEMPELPAGFVTDKYGFFSGTLVLPDRIGVYIFKVNYTTLDGKYGEANAVIRVVGGFITLISPEAKVYFIKEGEKKVKVRFRIVGIAKKYKVKVTVESTPQSEIMEVENDTDAELEFTLDSYGWHTLKIEVLEPSVGVDPVEIAFMILKEGVEVRILHDWSKYYYDKDAMYSFAVSNDNSTGIALVFHSGFFVDTFASESSISMVTSPNSKIYLVFTRGDAFSETTKTFEERVGMIRNGKEREFGIFNFGYALSKVFKVTAYSVFPNAMFTEKLVLNPGLHRIVMRNLGIDAKTGYVVVGVKVE